LKAAQDANDKPAIAELGRRIVAIDPNDVATWNALAKSQLELEDLDDLGRTLDAWQKTARRPPAAIEDFRGYLCFKRKDYQCADPSWPAFHATKPAGAGRRPGCRQPAGGIPEPGGRGRQCAIPAKGIGAPDNAARRLLRAMAFLRLHKWDDAYADMAK